MNNAAIEKHLASLAIATADYESAWRASVARETGANAAMDAAYGRQKEARDAVIAAGLPAEVVYAIEASLVIAAARPTGVRPVGFRNPSISSEQAAARFVRETVHGEGIA